MEKQISTTASERITKLLKEIWFYTAMSDSAISSSDKELNYTYWGYELRLAEYHVELSDSFGINITLTQYYKEKIQEISERASNDRHERIQSRHSAA